MNTPRLRDLDQEIVEYFDTYVANRKKQLDTHGMLKDPVRLEEIAKQVLGWGNSLMAMAKQFKAAPEIVKPKTRVQELEEKVRILEAQMKPADDVKIRTNRQKVAS